MQKRVKYSWLGAFLLLMLAVLLAACTSTTSGSMTISGNGSGGTTVANSTATTAANSSSTAGNSATPGGSARIGRPILPFIGIRMLDQNNGWGITKNTILKTADGGIQWQDVTPAQTPGGGYAMAKGDFLSTQVAWVASAQENANTVTVQSTSDGGLHWQEAIINDAASAAVDMPHFLNRQEGWLEVIGDPGAGSEGADIFHSVDGGLHWTKIASDGDPSSGLSLGGFKSGISFVNSSTGFATTSSTTGNPADAGLYATHDGGKTWQHVTLPMPQNTNVEQIGTTPPVFFGNAGFLPAHVFTQNGQRELILYRTNDGGNTWMLTTAVSIDASTVYVLDTSHAWASDSQSGSFYYTTDGGTSWGLAGSKPGKINELSFIDANNGWAATDNALLRTRDGGKTWQAIAV